jgi:hypothetical protein
MSQLQMISLEIPENENTPLVKQLREKITELSQKIIYLEQELLKLKKETTRPKIKPSKLNNPDNKDNSDGDKPERKSTKGVKKNKKSIKIHEEKVVEPDDIPEDAVFVKYYEIEVQDIIIKPHNTRYKLAQYRTKDGKYITAKLPNNSISKHFGVELCTFILYQYHHQHVTQPLLLEQINDMGIDMSSGQLSNIITENLEEFHQEKNDILKAGLSNPEYIQTDDTGARHKGVNGYCTQIGNEFFTWFESTQRKSRINFLELLSNGVKETLYTLNNISLEYMQKQQLPQKHYAKLEEIKISITDKDEFTKWLKTQEIITPKNIKIVTEAALIGGLTTQGIPVDLSIISDGARQFNIFDHAMCWVHAERRVNRLIPVNDENKILVEETREEIWNLYQKLKEYKLDPALNMKDVINSEFDEFANKTTTYDALNTALQYFKNNKSDLLKVLENPSIPLHNNLSERDIRDYVKKRKISGSTRSDNGRKARDTFASLKKTCKKLAVSFNKYLHDRISGENKIENLGESVKLAYASSG